jgi:hypothetical protein
MLRSSAVLLGGGAVGALAQRTVVSNAAAQADTALSVSGDEVTIRNGSLAAVNLSLTVAWEYAVPSGERPDTVEIDVRAGQSADALQAVASGQSSEAFLESSGEQSFEVDLLAEGVLSADALVPSEGGTTAETEAVIGAEMRLLDESGLAIATDSQTATSTLSVTKSDYDPSEYGTVSGSGELTIELE